MNLKSVAVISLFITLICGSLSAETVPAGWKILQDDKGLCQAAYPPDWATTSVMAGSVMFSKPPQVTLTVINDPFTLKPMPEQIQKTVPQGKFFENTDKRVFYSSVVNKMTSLTVSVPSKKGSCTARVTYGAGVAEETAKKIALSISSIK